MIHDNPTHLVQIIENVLDNVYKLSEHKISYEYKWKDIHRWYEKRYLNPDSPFKKFMKLYGSGQGENK